LVAPVLFLPNFDRRPYGPLMERRHTIRRHTIRRGADKLWEVYDVDDQNVVHIDGVPLAHLQDDEALDALELLEGGFLVPSDLPMTG